MKRIILISLFLSLTLSSCIQHMEEVETTMIAGSWAKVDGNNMACAFLTFDSGYMYEYNPGDEFYLFDNTVWGASFSSIKSGNTYKYALVDGRLHYYNAQGDFYTDLIREGDAIIFGGNKYLMVNEINQSHYSRIILSETNKTDLNYSGEHVEWDYEIENPVHGNKLKVLEAPGWCGGIDGVTVSDDKISFYADSTKIDNEGKFKFSYRTADDVEIEVKQLMPVRILLDPTYVYLSYYGQGGKIKYTILNAPGLKPIVTTDVKWLKATIDSYHNRIEFIAKENNKYEERAGKIIVTCEGSTASCTVYQRAKIIN